MSQFRQFWIWGFKVGADESISQNCLVNLDKGGSEFYSPVHHVIEIAALEAKQKEIEQLKHRLSYHENGTKIKEINYDEMCAIENAKLSAALNKAVERLESIVEVENFLNPETKSVLQQDCESTLAEINKIKEGLG